MQRMQMRMKLPLKHDIRYAQHYRCQASEVELFAKAVNDLKAFKAVIVKHMKGGGSRSRSVA